MTASIAEETSIQTDEPIKEEGAPPSNEEDQEKQGSPEPENEAAPQVRDPVARIQLNDWIFLGLAWLWLSYLTVITIDEYFYPQPVWNGFDYLPVLAGFPILCLGWPVSRLSRRLETAFQDLRSGAGISIKGDLSRLEQVVKRRKLYARIICSAALFVVLGIYFFWLVQSGNFDSFIGSDWTLSLALMIPVSVGIGSFIGYIFGGLYGSLTYLTSMKEIGASFARTDTEQAREALSTMSKIVGFTLLLTLALCHWFIGWFLFWVLGFEDGRDYRLNYGLLFVGLLFMSFLFYIFVSVLPTISFRRQVKGLILEPEVLDRQKEDIKRDIRDLETVETSDRSAAIMMEDLKKMDENLDREPKIQWLPNRAVLIGLALWIALWIPLGYFAVTQQQAPAAAAFLMQSYPSQA
jgi:hypothetical protein